CGSCTRGVSSCREPCSRGGQQHRRCPRTEPNVKVSSCIGLQAFLLVLLAAVTAPVTAQQPGVTPDSVPTLPDSLRGLTCDTLPAYTLPPRPPLAASADSVLQLLRRHEGFTVTEYHGTRA